MDSGSRGQRDQTSHETSTGFRWDSALLTLVGASIVACFVMCLRGQGQPRIWLGLVTLSLVVSLGISDSLRYRFRRWLTDLRDSLASYSQGSDTIPLQGTFIFAVVPALFFYLSGPTNYLAMGDSWPVLPTTDAIFSRGSPELTPYLSLTPQGYSEATVNGLPYCFRETSKGLYSSYPSGIVPLVFPMVALAHAVNADFSTPMIYSKLERWSSAWIAAFTLGLFFLLALHLAPLGPAWVATALLTVGSSVYTTNAQALWQQGGVAFWAMLFLLVEFRNDRKPFRAAALVQGIICAQLLSCRLSTVVILAPLGLWCLWRNPRHGLGIGIFAILAYAPWAWYYYSIYGTPFGPSVQQMEQGLWKTNFWEPLLGVLFSPSRGFFVYQPWLLLFPFAFLRPATNNSYAQSIQGAPKGWAVACGSAIVLEILLVSSWICWWGGACWGSRLLADVVPIAGLLIVPAVAFLWQRRHYGILAATFLLSFAVHSSVVHFRAEIFDHDESNRVAGQTHPLWDWSRAPFGFPWRHN